MDISYFNVASESYRKVRNTLRFLLSNIFDLETSEENKEKRDESLKNLKAESVNSYILSELTVLQENVLDAFKEFKFKTASTLLYDFCNDTLSSLYCVAVKDRLYCDPKNSKNRLESQYTLWQIIDTLCHLLAPFLPHTAEENYQSLYQNKEKSIHLETIRMIKFSTSEKWTELLDIRSDILKALEASKEQGIENSLDAGILIGKNPTLLNEFKDDLADLFGVSRVTISQNDELKVSNLKNEPRCERSWKRDTTVKERENGLFLSDRDLEAVEYSKSFS